MLKICPSFSILVTAILIVSCISPTFPDKDPKVGEVISTQDLSRFDHMILGAPSLESGIQFTESLFGVRAKPGGSHPGEGTRNALLSLGDETYLEIMVPDPAQGHCPGFPEELSKLSRPGLLGWASRSSSLASLATAVSTTRLTSLGPIKASRQGNNGSLLQWELLFLSGHDFGSIIPFFINWGTTNHPASAAPRAGTLIGFTIGTPHSKQVSDLLNTISVRAQVVASPKRSLTATIRVDGRNVVLTSSDETMALTPLFAPRPGPCVIQ